MKKSFILSASFFLLANVLLAQNGQTQPKYYCIISYHKLNPGKTMEDALGMERKWKLLHQTKKEAGLIADWAIYSMFYGAKTPDIDYDYVTAMYGFDLDKMASFPDDIMNQFVKKYPQHANIFTEPGASSLVRNEAFVSEAHAGEYKPNSYILVEDMKVRPENFFEYIELEKKAAAVHQERVKAGVITQWSFWRRVLPTGYDGATYFLTASEYPSLSAIEVGGYTDEDAQKALNMSFGEAYFKFAKLREVKSSKVVTLVDKL